MFDDENFNVFKNEEEIKEKEKINRAKLPRKARNFSKEQLQLALRKKKDCNTKALKIVETLLDPVDDVDKFLLMLKDINQCHFDDVVQERAVQKICGYPLCQKELTNILKQKYVISLSNKKIYDITERKNFCSGDCYKASNFIKEQMLTGPLWLRDQEDIPKFRLLNHSEPQATQIPKAPNIEITQHPVFSGLSLDKLQIVERTYSEQGESSKANEAQDHIPEESEVDQIYHDTGIDDTVGVESLKDILSECLGKMSLENKS